MIEKVIKNKIYMEIDRVYEILGYDFDEHFLKSLKGTYIKYKNDYTNKFKVKSISISEREEIIILISIENSFFELELSNFYIKKYDKYNKLNILDILYKIYKKVY